MRKIISIGMIFSFIGTSFALPPAYAQGFNINQLPEPGHMVGVSESFMPLALKGLLVNPQKPLEFQFIVDTGKGPQDIASVKEQSNRLIKYFLAGLTIPEGDLWVNLSPYEKERMIAGDLGQTELGRDLLAQDYILKQLTSSLIYPEKDLGKEFWAKVYKQAREKFGTTDVPINTFNKVWILPDQAQVFENGHAAYVTKSTLKVMLDEDYLARQKHASVHNGSSAIGDNIVRAIILPEIRKEVNTGRNFALLRQIYDALILAKWYKQTIQNSLLDAVYMNKKKTSGVNLSDPEIKAQIYQRYLQAYKKGVFNYIKDDVDPDGQIVPRKYFSGGISEIEPKHVDTDGAMSAVKSDGKMLRLDVDLQKFKDQAMASSEKTTPSVYTDIVDLITRLNLRGINPKIHNTDLGVFNHDARIMVDFIKQYSVLKNPEDIYRVLLWRLQAKGGNSNVPLSGLESSRAELLYNSIFDQAQFLSDMRQQKKPLNIVLFRRGRTQQLTSMLKTFPGVNIKLILSGTDDGLSWYYGAREFGATGISGAGQALVDLSTDLEVARFVSWRMAGEGRTDEELEKDFKAMLSMLVGNPAEKTILSDEMKNIYIDATRMDVDKRKQIVADLKSFFAYWDQTRNPNSRFSLKGVPIRSILLVGMAQRLDHNWQKAMDELGQLLGVHEGDAVILPTEERQHLVGIREDGTVYFSETAINLYSNFSHFLGLWLLDQTTYNKIYNSITSQSMLDLGDGHKVSLKGVGLFTHIKLSESDRVEVQETTRKVYKNDARLLAEYFSKVSTTGSLSEKKTVLSDRGKDVLKEADIILYSDEFLETTMGGALIVPGVGEAIKDNKKAVKINLVEVSSKVRSEHVLVDYLERVYRYLTGKMLHGTKQTDLKGVENYVNYVLGGVVDPKPAKGMAEKVEAASNDKVYAVTVDAQTQQERGFYALPGLIGSVIGLYGIKNAGFAISNQHGLMVATRAQEGLPQDKLQMGLFSNSPEVQDLIKEIKADWPKIVEHGAFVFDVDNTILPKNAHGLTDYPRLANLFMLLLREDVKVAIISGNSQQEQMARIYEAIKKQMKDDLFHFKFLTFYVNGGATKIGFDDAGNAVESKNYNAEHGMPLNVLKIAINGAVKQLARNSFNLAPDRLEKFMEETRKYVADKYPDLHVEFPWRTDRSWEPEWVTPEELAQRKGDVIAPWVEMRGESYLSVASIAVKPTPKFTAADGTEVDVRDDLQETMMAYAKAYNITVENFKFRSGGSTTTDITKANAEKPEALLDFVDTNSLDQKYVYVVGDEFKVHKEKEGNDEPIARDPRLQGIHTLAVNADDMAGAAAKTLWIGRTPQATYEFLKAVLEKPDKVTTDVDNAMNGGIDFNQINVDRTGKAINMQFDQAQLNELTQGGFKGFTPVITSITPISSPLSLLGIASAKDILEKA